MAWVNTPKASECYQDTDYAKRVPTPKYQYLKNLENLALTAAKINLNLRVHVVCSGLPYGNGEANDIFYEFFRRAWLSSHPELAALPVIGAGQNSLPTIHVSDLAKCVRSLAEAKEPIAKQYFVAVDQCKKSKQKDIM
jgi:nucleoside-diphosphate-sugar epimerase